MGTTCTAFAGDRRIAHGDLPAVLHQLRAHLARGQHDGLLVFDDQTGRQVDVDLRDTPEQRAEPAPPPEPAGPPRGRPKLGVVSREVSLLPRHWEWLEAQPNGISAALRRLIDEARKAQPDEARARLAREAAHRVMTAMAGDRPGYEEALRALFARDRARFEAQIAGWPSDVRGYVGALAEASF